MGHSALPIFKISATGNDFLLVDLLNSSHLAIWQAEYSARSRSEWVVRWCDRQECLGADGVVFLEAITGYDFRWDFYNSDGGTANMCGNAARAVSHYFFKKTKPAEVKFLTLAGEVRGWSRGPGIIEVQLPALLPPAWNQVSQHEHSFDLINPGVPHAVLQVEDLENKNGLGALALKIKAESRFKTDGVNVTFVRKMGEDRIQSITFERGVENFTRACGTGAIAAAESLLHGKNDRPIEVAVPGGTLTVVFKGGFPHLIGAAKISAQLHLIQEA